MKAKLTTGERLKDLRVVNKQLNLEELAKCTGLSKSALGNYESKDFPEMSSTALVTLAKFYNVSTDYLLGLSETIKFKKTLLADLNLSDPAVEVLVNKTFNHGLLSELICLPGFLRLLTDIEVCVDGVADMHVKDMNLVLENARKQVINMYHPDENDPILRTLELAQVKEDLFYSYAIHEDIDAIVEKLRENHKDDSATAEPKTEAKHITENVKEILDEALDYEGTTDEKRAFMVCRTLDINYAMLPEEDRKAFARVCKRSPILRTAFSQRGKARPSSGKKK